MFLNFEKPSPNYNVVRAVFVAKRLEYLPIGSLSRVGRDQRVPRAAIEVRSDCWMVFYFHLFPIRQTGLKIWRSSATTCGTVAAVRLIASRFCAFRSICLRSLVVGGKRESWECKANPTGYRQIGVNINDGGGDDDDEEEDQEEEDQEEEAEEEEEDDHDHAPGDGRRRAPITKSYALGNMAATGADGTRKKCTWYHLSSFIRILVTIGPRKVGWTYAYKLTNDHDRSIRMKFDYCSQLI